jgi:hypothetical protein
MISPGRFITQPVRNATPHAMDRSRKSAPSSHREALVSMIGLYFVEEQGLLPRELLEDARASLAALFLRTSGEETMLRKLIDVLKTTRLVHRSFAAIATTIEGVRKSAVTLDTKLTTLREYLKRLQLTAEEGAAFFEPFLGFSQEFQRRIEALARSMSAFLERKETEAKVAGVYNAAREARDRLKQRLSSNLVAEASGEVETRIKQEVIQTFDYSEAEAALRQARRESRAAENEIRLQLEEMRLMCQLAMNPAMRDMNPDGTPAIAMPPFPDVFALFVDALRKYPRLATLKDAVLELFRLYQHSHGIFRMDFETLGRAITTIFDNPEAYFETREEDRDIRRQQEKLRMIEGLIPFLENAAELLRDEELEPYNRFSRRISEALTDARAPWVHISESLLRAKIQAEADLSTRL